MTKPFRFASAASLMIIGSVLAGCASTSPKTRVVSSGFGGSAGGNVGLATRALAAYNAENYAEAVSFAERAVEKTPDDAGFRALLGNSYFGAGRFASAEAAYKDSLTIYANQPQVILKLALAQIAQGRGEQAAAFLDSARSMLDASDYGLALALAGRPADAVLVLDPAAREVDAGPRVRQNLALAHALSGNWTQARVVAAQDVAPGDLDARIQQWMQLAKPANAADQVAALTGVTPAASDPGQPVRLAFRKTETRTAEAAPVAPAPAPEPAVPQFSQASVPALPPVVEVPVAPAPAPVEVASAEPAPAFAPPPPPPARLVTASADEYSYVVPPAKPMKAKATAAKAPAAKAPLRKASAQIRSGKSTAVVQLGAYASPQRVAAAWDAAARKYSGLRPYAPMSARFESNRGTVYRLSVKGFDSPAEAKALCSALKRSGAACFVRNVAGDAPVRIASR
jgi:Flp pilus assembly protein TadD